MKSFFLGLAARFDALAQRERYLVAVALLGGVLLIGWSTLIDPALARTRLVERGIAEQRTQLAALTAQLQALQAPEQSPEAQAAVELAELRAQINTLRQRYTALGGALVAPQQVAGLLEELLGRQSGLRLLGLRTLPVTPVLASKGDAAASKAPAANVPATGAANEQDAAAGLYKHGVEIRVEGSYAQLADYLARLEKAPQKLLWASVTLSAENHPRLLLTLTVYTLSRDRTWLIV